MQWIFPDFFHRMMPGEKGRVFHASMKEIGKREWNFPTLCKGKAEKDTPLQPGSNLIQ